MKLNKINHYESQNKQKNINFKATPQQILNKIDNVEICAGRIAFLKETATFFLKLQEKMSKSKNLPKEFIYKLGEENKIPKRLLKTKVAIGSFKPESFESFDKKLNTSTFKCSPTSTCGCGKGMSLSGFAAEILEKIGVEEPTFIKISRQ